MKETVVIGTMNGTSRLAAAVVVSSLLVGCAGGGGSAGVCGGDAYWTSDGVRTIGEAAIAGAVIGGLAGGIASRGDAGTTVLAAGIGALVGAGVGCGVNAVKAGFREKEDSYDRQLAEMARLNSELRSKAGIIRKEQADLNQEVARLRSARMNAVDRHNAARSMQADIQGKVDSAKQLLAAAQADLQKEETLVAAARAQYGATSEEARKLEQERDNTRRVIVDLDSQVKALIGASGQLSTL